MKDLGARAFNYGYPAPVLIVATYNDDGSVNVMNLHECTRTNAGQLALCIGEGKKTHENIAKRRAFTLTVADKSLMAEMDYFGLMSGYKVPDKFARAGLTATKSNNVDAPIIDGIVTREKIFVTSKILPSTSPDVARLIRRKSVC